MGSLCWASLAFTFTAIGLVLFLWTAAGGGHSAGASVVHAINDTNAMSQSTSLLNMSAASIVSDLANITSSCNLQPALAGQISEYSAQIQQAAAEVSSLHSNASLASSKLEDLQKNGGVEGLWAFFMAVLAVPLVLTTMVCAVMLLVLFSTSCMRRGSSCAKCEDIVCFKIGSIGLAITVLAMAWLTSCQFAAGIALSSYCSDFDVNTLEVLEVEIGPSTEFYRQNGPDIWNVSNYYIAADRSNPFMEKLSSIRSLLGEASQELPVLEVALQFTCPGVASTVAHIGHHLEVANEQANTTAGILEPTNVYQYYSDARHQLCGPIIDGLGWVALFQVLVGMLCLPFLACTVESFVHRRAFEQQNEQEAALTRDWQEQRAQNAGITLA